MRRYPNLVKELRMFKTPSYYNTSVVKLYKEERMVQAGGNSHELRPYYDPDTFNAGYSVIFKPGFGLINTETNKPLSSSVTSTIKAINNSGNSGMQFGTRGIGIHAMNDLQTGSLVEKNYVYDLEFQEYFDLNNLTELFKNLIINFTKNYCKVFASQPLEIVRLYLQVGKFDFDSKKSKKKNINNSTQSSFLLSQLSETEDSDSEDINYFQSTDVEESYSNVKRTKSTNENLITSSQIKQNCKIDPISIHTMDIMTSIVSKDGPFALFKGVNASFIYSTLSHTIEAWITGFISPFLGIPDPFFLDLTHSNDPLKSLWLSVSACVLTGLILMPLDLIRVKFMITQFNKPIEIAEESKSQQNLVLPAQYNTRSVRESLRNYPLQTLLKPPSSITILTILHQLSQSVFRKTAPYILFIKFNMDNYSAPNIYTFVNLILLIFEFFIKLPVENLLRKEQVRFLLKPKSLTEDPMKVLTIENPNENLIINFNDYYRNSDPTISTFTKIKLLGLFNGWRVGVLNVVGFWGYNILKTSSSELIAERL